MRTTSFVVAAALVIGCGPTGDEEELAGEEVETTSAALEAGSRFFIWAFRREHNQVRGEALPAPSPALPPMVWHSVAAATAQAWANKCRFEHNPNKSTVSATNPNGIKLGENIAWRSPPGFTGPGSVVRSWASEAAFYHYATNSCDAGKVCGHYTQIVWRASTGLGCGMAICPGPNPKGGSGPWEMWVCDYAPAGNVIGQKPY